MIFEKIFLGGSKTTAVLPKRVIKLLELFMCDNVRFLIGDCCGVDLAMQIFLHSKGYRNVTVYCSGDKSRFNIGEWKVKHIPVDKSVDGYSFYQAKDIAMVSDCDGAFMLWDGKTRGTKNNIADLKKRGIPIFIYYTDINEMKVIRRKAFREDKE